jgi:outer membrane protein TolC
MTRRLIVVWSVMAALAAPSARAQGLTGSRPGPGTLAGGVPSGERTDAPLALALVDAVERGLKNNLGMLISAEDVRTADGTRWRALSAVLPDVSASLSAAREKINLAAFGFTGPGIPQLVGPFNVYDARVRLSQSVIDLSAARSLAAGNHALDAAKADYQDARGLVVAAIANMYLVAVADQSRVEAAEAAEKTARTVHQLAVDQNEAGIVPKLDALRADVELRSASQRLIVTRNELDKDKLALARAIGLPLGQTFTLADSVPFAPAPNVDVQAATGLAFEARDDLKAARARLAEAEAAARAAAYAHLPSLTVDADYGVIGNTMADSLGTFAVSANVHVPLFDGGRTRARTIDANAELARRRAEMSDLRARVYYDIEAAALDLNAASDQVTVAREAVTVADQALGQAQDRFKAGVAGNLEVVQAQQALTAARENYISSLYAHNVAKVAMARALGSGESEFLQLLEGTTPWPTAH